jgi:hypothetical protein
LGAGSGSRRALDGPAPASFVFVPVLLDLAAGSRTVCTRVPGPLAFRGGRWNLFRRDGRRGDVLKLLVFDKSKPDLHWKKKKPSGQSQFKLPAAAGTSHPRSLSFNVSLLISSLFPPLSRPDQHRIYTSQREFSSRLNQ